MANWTTKERLQRDIVRFWKNTKRVGNCIIWTGALDADGYGKFTTTVYPKIQSTHKAHRWIYQQVLGQLDSKLVTLHTCDNRACIKPQHLDAGSSLFNNQDKVNKRRHDFGENHARATLTEEQVQEIKQLLLLGVKRKDLQEKYCTSKDIIGKIARNQTWRHLK